MDVCVVCQNPVHWHFEDGRYLNCDELRIRLTGRLPVYTSCTSPQMWRDIAAIERVARKRRARRS
jgi:hypothetical protein